jgi:regulatory protein
MVGETVSENPMSDDAASPGQAASHERREAAADIAAIRRAAVDLLARREQSLEELRAKLQRRFADAGALEAVLEELREEGLQSDERYAESFIRQRIQRGYGPLRLQQELRHKGLSPSQFAEALDRLEIDWHSVAAQAYRKKFGATMPADLRDKARRLRFLQYRGFTAEQVSALLE